MHELGDHHSRAQTPYNSFITPRQRDFIKELARENLMPMRNPSRFGTQVWHRVCCTCQPAHGAKRRAPLSANAPGRIDFLLGDADPELVHVRAVPPMRTFVPELNRTREDMAISAQFGVHYARM
ncbi:hypothetical protein PI126_g18005 [Phytophthora idaei]|nr:hypothetical protein PI126_g18005 [Phytophthora idaei]